MFTEKVEPAYTWSQTGEDITVTFKLPPDVTKTDVVCELRSGNVTHHYFWENIMILHKF